MRLSMTLCRRRRRRRRRCSLFSLAIYYDIWVITQFMILRYINTISICLSSQVLSALDILQPPHLDFFQEMYPFQNN